MDCGGAVPYLRQEDYERMLGLAVAVLESRRPETVWRLIAQELLRTLDGSVLLMKDEEWTPSSGTVGVWLRDAPAPVEPAGATAGLVRSGYPFATHYGRHTDREPRTAAQLAGDRAWRHSGTASALRESFGTRHMLGLPLPGGDDGAVRGFIVHRDGADFDARDLDYATRVQPLLAAAAAQCRLLGGLRGTGGPEPEPEPVTGGLTPRETAVLHTLAEGLPATAMARRLGVSVRTVHKHLQNLYRKLGTADRLGTVLRAQEAGLLPSVPPSAPAGRPR
ncbi:response regulator transcription factor [Streptomyces lavendulocolor]|uniref:helix-turn-helix transcriptional regulator n=1 Tax=Streptomyces lavendulocolor TaxID=67316 RepID=UPI003C2E87C5